MLNQRNNCEPRVGFDSRLQDIAEIWRDNRWLYMLTGIILGLIMFPAVQLIRADATMFLQSLVPEAIGIIFTALIIERMLANQALKELKARLLREAGGRSGEIANAAIDRIRAEGWHNGSNGLLAGAQLGDAVLNGANLTGADLTGANLWGANLTDATMRNTTLVEANLQSADLSGVSLSMSDFSNANMEFARLTRATMWIRSDQRTKDWEKAIKLVMMFDGHTVGFAGANLAHARLYEANLTGADMYGTNLEAARLDGARLGMVDFRGANLRSAILEGANLEDAVFNTSTMLPDGSFWTPDTDLTRFTEPGSTPEVAE